MDCVQLMDNIITDVINIKPIIETNDKTNNSEQPQQLLIQLLNEKARQPQKGTSGSAGYDLYSCEQYNVAPGAMQIVKTGIKIKLPQNSYGRIAPRSSLAVKHNIFVNGGVIDEDYRGEVGIILVNFSKEEFNINIGDRIAQLIIEKLVPTQCLVVDQLDDTVRSDGGFGSTGK